MCHCLHLRLYLCRRMLVFLALAGPLCLTVFWLALPGSPLPRMTYPTLYYFTKLYRNLPLLPCSDVVNLTLSYSALSCPAIPSNNLSCCAMRCTTISCSALYCLPPPPLLLCLPLTSHAVSGLPSLFCFPMPCIVLP